MFATLIALALGGAANARVFNWKEATLAAFVRANGGATSLGKRAFADALGDGESVDASSRLNYGAEIGVLLAPNPFFHVRFGAELLQYRPVSEASGVNGSGTEMYRLDSSVSVFNPNVTLEYAGMPRGPLRYYGYLGAGYADVTVENKFRMTTAGTGAHGVNDFNELLSGQALAATLGGGVEILFNDNVTCALDLGWRYLRVPSLKYKGDADTIRGSVGKGAPALNADGEPRTLDLSGPTIGVGFRFYLNFL